MKAQLEGSLGAPHQGAAAPLCRAPLRHHLLPALPASDPPEVLHNLVLNADVGHGGIWFRQQELQVSIGVSRKEESKEWKRIEE